MLFLRSIKPFQPIAAFQIETSYLICKAKQMTSFYMKHTNGLKLVKTSWFQRTILFSHGKSNIRIKIDATHLIVRAVFFQQNRC